MNPYDRFTKMLEELAICCAVMIAVCVAVAAVAAIL